MVPTLVLGLVAGALWRRMRPAAEDKQVPAVPAP
jgi:hypothetical protein